MKKYLLSTFLGLFGLVGAFASAENYSFISDSSDNYSPSSFTTDGGIASNFNLVCDNQYESDCYIKIRCPNSDECFTYDDYTSTNCLITSDYGVNSVENNCNLLDFSAGTYTVDSDGDTAFSSVSFTIGDSGNAGTEEINPGIVGPLLSGGTSNFTTIIGSLSSTLQEFIPYLVYLGLGILGAIISFVAIKWLMNRVRAKVFGTFSGGRRR